MFRRPPPPALAALACWIALLPGSHTHAVRHAFFVSHPLFPGFLTVLASLHADGMVRLRDSDGEEILAFDAGHEHAIAPPLSPVASSSAMPINTAAGPPETTAVMTTATTNATPPAIGMTGDSSEGDPVLVTAGADGTVRVHSLTVRYRGKRVAGGRGGKGKPLGGGSGGGTSSRRHEQQQKQKQKQVPSMAEEAPEHLVGDPGSRDARHGSPPATARGVGITASFRVCLGSECGRGAQGEQTVGAATDGDAGVDPDGEGGTGEAQRLPDGEVVAAVTSMDAYYHRA